MAEQVFEHWSFILGGREKENGIFNEHSSTKEIEHRLERRGLLESSILLALPSEVLREDADRLSLWGRRAREKSGEGGLLGGDTSDGPDLERFTEEEPTLDMPEDLVGLLLEPHLVLLVPSGESGQIEQSDPR